MLAGFHVTGVDIKPQPRFRGDVFVQGDALEYLHRCGKDFEIVHASPPCQSYSSLKSFAKGNHPMLIGETREALRAIGRPWVIENVVGAPLDYCLKLCGTMFHLETSCGAQLRRHRLFESSIMLMSPGACQHGKRTLAVNGPEFRDEKTRWAERRETISVCGDIPHNLRLWRAEQRKLSKTISIHGGKADDPRREGEREKQRTIMVVGATARDPAKERLKYRTTTVTGTVPQQNVVRKTIRETFSVDEARRAMGIDWMVMKELSQAIPPKYTEFIGLQFIRYIENTR